MYESTAVLKLQEDREQENRIQEVDQARIEELKKELDACEGVTSSGGKQVLAFMVREKIWHIADLGYSDRERFIEYISGKYKKAHSDMCRYDFDRIKRQWLQRPVALPAGEKIWIPPYKTEIFYLPYHPDERVQEITKNIRMKEALVWDFTIKASEKLKHQVFKMIHYILESDSVLATKRIHLASLNRYYRFCAERGISDLEMIEQWQVKEYCNSFSSVSECAKGLAIIGVCRRELFFHAKEINWEAHVWFLERFHLQQERIEPSNPVQRLSFLEVEYSLNRKFLKEYIRYSLGMTQLAIRGIASELEQIRDFLKWLEQRDVKDLWMVTRETMDEYFQLFDKQRGGAQAFNDRLICIYHFFCFLQVRKHIRELPFQVEYYRKKIFPHHLDRSVESETAEEIIQNLHKLPENQRMMFLHLWCLGLRVSEVCTLKGNAYFTKNGDFWILVYQNKMREHKWIPAPQALYELMQVYLKKYKIGPDDYVFQSPLGGPYRSITFCKQMRSFCRENGFQRGEYLFRSHDYRHRVATEYYDNGVSIQGVRDYLGHGHEEMTRKYIDFMPKRIEKANNAFFEQHSLATSLRKEWMNK